MQACRRIEALFYGSRLKGVNRESEAIAGSKIEDFKLLISN